MCAPDSNERGWLMVIARGDSKSLSGEQVHTIVARRLPRIDGFSFLESFAMFMGKAQLVELGLKNILTSKYGYDDERIERWSLGRVIKELRKCGLRQDFVHLRKSYKNTATILHTKCWPTMRSCED
jgi:hypothetical protein